MIARRRRLLLAGIPFAVVAVVFAIAVTAMLRHHGQGEEDFARTAYIDAADSFRDADALNPFEDWISAFDHGAALHADGRWEAAIEDYQDALAEVPVREECTVRINLALAQEAIGDAAADADPPRPEEAREAWEAGLEALREGACPTDAGRGEEQTEDAAEVEERLEQKLREQQSQEKKDRQDPQEQKEEKKRERREEREQKERERKERELENRNSEGEDRRSRREQERESNGYGDSQW